MTSVFITGAHGFLGRALGARFRADGWEVRGVDFAAGDGVVAGDVSAPGEWQAHAAGCDLVIHTAAVVSLRASGRDAVWRANVVGTRNAYAAAERGGAARFLHLSTVVVFGFDFPDGVDERAAVRVTGLPYGDTKIAAEQLLLQAHAEGRTPVTIIRPGDVYGPGSRAWATIPFELIRARRFALPGRAGIFSPVYVDDLVEGVVLAAGADAAAGQVLTLAGGAGVPNHAFFGAYAALAGRRLLTVPAPALLAATRLVSRGEVNAYSTRYLMRRGTYSIEKARSLVGYAPAVAVDEGLRRTVDWLRAQAWDAVP
jgi:nucleoside-diphosphate-sugar epimerase